MIIHTNRLNCGRCIPVHSAHKVEHETLDNRRINLGGQWPTGRHSHIRNLCSLTESQPNKHWTRISAHHLLLFSGPRLYGSASPWLLNHYLGREPKRLSSSQVRSHPSESVILSFMNLCHSRSPLVVSFQAS
jgi:hypothetical protein